MEQTVINEQHDSHPMAEVRPSVLLGSKAFRYGLHVLVMYISAMALSPFLAGLLHHWIAPLLRIRIAVSSFQFYFSHLLVISFVPALMTGYINSKYRHTSAMWVWVIPAAVMAVKLATFPAQSVLASRWAEATAYYFGSNWPVPATLDEAFRSNMAGMRVYAQIECTAPFYAGLGYSIGALAGKLRLAGGAPSCGQ